MSTLVPDENAMKDLLCNSSFGSMVSLDYVTPDTKEVAHHVERCTWDLLRVRELSEWMRDDVYSEVLAGRVFVTLGVKFAEMAKSERKFGARAENQGNNNGRDPAGQSTRSLTRSRTLRPR